MHYRASPFAVVIGAFLTLAGCQDAIVSPRVIPPPDQPTGPHVQADFPLVPPGAAVYNRTTSSNIPGSSRYVFYDDSTFRLQYLRPDWGFFEYPGRYVRADSVIRLYFDAESVAGDWLAAGILSGDTLIVKYNLVMSLSDFEDGVYTRQTDAR